MKPKIMRNFVLGSLLTAAITLSGCSEGISGRYDDNQNGYLEFMSDGTVFGQTSNGMSVAGTYKVEGYDVTITWANGFAYRGKLQGDTFTGNDGVVSRKR